MFKFYKKLTLDLSIYRLALIPVTPASVSSHFLHILLLTKWFRVYPHFYGCIHFAIDLFTFCFLFSEKNTIHLRNKILLSYRTLSIPSFFHIRWSESTVD